MLIGIGIVGGAMNAAMRSETIVEKFKTIEKNFAMIVVNCARTGVSLGKIYATAPARGEIEQDRRELAKRQGGVSKGPKRTETRSTRVSPRSSVV